MQQPAASSSGNAPLPGADADVPGEEPSAPPQKKNDASQKKPDNSMPGADADVPGEEPASSTKPHAPLPEMPTDGKEADPPASSQAPQSPPAGTSSSQPAFSSSSDPQAMDEPAPTTQDDDTPVKAAPLQNLGAKDNFAAIHEKLDQTRVADDLKVAKFYFDDGNYQGAYLRYTDALAHDAEEEDAHWGLAQVAEKLKKPDEALAHYQKYLELASDGDHAKEAKAAVARLSGKQPAGKETRK